MSDFMTREEWDAYSADDQWQLYHLTEQREVDMKSVLEEIPECPDHGFCLPYKRQWIQQVRGLPQDDIQDALLAFDRAMREAIRTELT